MKKRVSEKLRTLVDEFLLVAFKEGPTINDSEIISIKGYGKLSPYEIAYVIHQRRIEEYDQ